MSEICPVCGLPKDICVCQEIVKEQQNVRVRNETRAYGKTVTIVEGIDSNDIDINALAKELKTICACGGTAKNSIITLQGEHKKQVKEILVAKGYNPEVI
ncbi:MAG: stress response translation initiation inhibitor YciH [Thermoplasmata archaeon HGW-Thermoplasmata-2]|nr:MAG: stress response translation initiation inhibitor YciH [Thermoplasmata archaeon HGW-Thermoplasmata-2]